MAEELFNSSQTHLKLFAKGLHMVVKNWDFLWELENQMVMRRNWKSWGGKVQCLIGFDTWLRKFLLPLFAGLGLWVRFLSTYISFVFPCWCFRLLLAVCHAQCCAWMTFHFNWLLINKMILMFVSYIWRRRELKLYFSDFDVLDYDVF